MKPSFSNRLSVAGVLFATLGLPAAAAAQYQLPTLTSSAKADSLHDEAAALVAAHRYGDAARLHRRRSSGTRTIRSASGASRRPRSSSTRQGIARPPGPT